MTEYSSPFLPQDVVYILQVDAHMDEKDVCPSISFQVGYYKGRSVCSPIYMSNSRTFFPLLLATTIAYLDGHICICLVM
jgi:hypothetical protein